MTDRSVLPSIGEVPEQPRMVHVLAGELENVLERPGDYVARGWSEEDGSESLAAWQGRALRELVRRLMQAETRRPPEPERPELVEAVGATWRRGPGLTWAKLDADGRETAYALTWEQLSGLPGGVVAVPEAVALPRDGLDRTVRELLRTGLAIWFARNPMTLNDIAECLSVVAGDLSRQARWESEGRTADSLTVRQELGNLLLSAPRWMHDLGLSVDSCLERAEIAQRTYAADLAADRR